MKNPETHENTHLPLDRERRTGCVAQTDRDRCGRGPGLCVAAFAYRLLQLRQLADNLLKASVEELVQFLFDVSRCEMPKLSLLCSYQQSLL